uniref:Uncharacterized protein n=1 Tax=Strongyloides venezuelensis TaxID=75913 RepID=A0A0K0FCF2_STRVS
MACLVTYGKSESILPAVNEATTGLPPQTPTPTTTTTTATITTTTTATITNENTAAPATDAAGLPYSGSNSIILSGLCALSIILGAKL